jgi:hypothetical protein
LTVKGGLKIPHNPRESKTMLRPAMAAKPARIRGACRKTGSTSAQRLQRHLLPQVQTQNQTDDIFLSPDEQNAFLDMMESCGICFRVRELPNDEWEYIAPELLPNWSDTQEQLLGRLRDDPPDAEATEQYTFVHAS